MKFKKPKIKKPQPFSTGAPQSHLSRELGSAALPILLLILLVVLRRVFLAGIHIPLLLLAGLSRLSTFLTLTMLALALLVLSLAVLAALLFIFFHIVCHLQLLHSCRTRLDALLRGLLLASFI
jgi:hypothetical protein